ncbi:MAG: hypothetical protein IKW30_13070, partial [Lachnospiraceae bacterium]|nr:hypothetical protein [Lachnospiraceae bacterium]
KKRRKKKIKGEKKTNHTLRNIIITGLILIVLGIGGYFGREYYLQKNAEASRENLRQYNVSILRKSITTAIEDVKEDAKKNIETARGLQEVWQSMWPEEIEITKENQKGFATIQECVISAEDNSKVVVSGLMDGIPKSDDRRIYIFNVATYHDGLIEGQEPITSIRKSDDQFSFTFNLNYKQANSRLFDKFAIGIKQNGKYVLLSDFSYITNPEQRAQYQYAYPKAASIKGLLVDPYKLEGNELKDLGVKQAAYNIPVGRLVGHTSSANYPTIYYNYQGQTYLFDGQVVKEYDIIFSRLTQLGIQTTAIILNDWNGSYLNLIHPNARSGGACPYYMFNASDKSGVDHMGAIATFLAERYSGTAHGQVVNWVIANEVNARKHWNYYPAVDVQSYAQVYADSFRVFYNAIKSVNACAKIYMPVDQTWNRNLNDGDYDARDIIDHFNAYIKSEGNIDWDLSHHPYPVPLTHAAFWNMPSNYKRMNLVTNSVDTKMVTMQNINVVTSYLQREELLNPNGESRSVILSEQGFNSLSGQSIQAAAFAYAYYIAEANSHIDGFLLNRQTDSSIEVAQGMAFGLNNADGSHKQIYNVFKQIDGPNSQSATEFAKSIIGISSWSDVIHHY